jgi:dTDP-4-dehydrorhamnose reductase
MLVLGGSGMLGHKLCQVAAETMEVQATFRREPDPSLVKLLASVGRVHPVMAETFATVEAALDRVRPDVAVNCIGIVKQLEAGKDPVACLTVNALFPHLLARACRDRGIRMITISTDCVFSGRAGHYREDDVTDVDDLYGRTKALGEVNGANCLTLRTSMIGREGSGAHGLVEWFLAQSGRSICGFKRAIFSGLTTLELSRLLVRIVREWPALEGLYQVASQPLSKYDLLQLIKAAYRVDVRIEPDDTFVCDRSLDGSRFRAATGYVAPSWERMIQAMSGDATPYEEIRRR